MLVAPCYNRITRLRNAFQYRKKLLLPHRQFVGKPPFIQSTSGCSPCTTAAAAVSDLETEKQSAGTPKSLVFWKHQPP